MISYQFKNTELLKVAITHKSFANERGEGAETHNEKLEFLGDAVLDLVLSDLLMSRYPQDTEGNLSKKRASLVNEAVLAQIAQSLSLHEMIRLGKGEILSQGNTKPRLLASVYEALLGAVYIDGGFQSVKDLISDNFDSVLSQMNPQEDYFSDFKTRLQELAQADLKATPNYQIVSESGPSHEPLFRVKLTLHQFEVSEGSGKSKKTAEQEAAKQAIEKWPEIKEKMKAGRVHV